MKNRIVLLLIISLWYSCAPLKYTSKTIAGTYLKVYEKGSHTRVQFTITENKFALVDMTDYKKTYQVYGCCDTITRGTWKLDDKQGLLSLSTPDLSSWISSTVREEEKFSKDSIYIFISSPVGRVFNKKSDAIMYSVALVTNGDWGFNLGDKFTNAPHMVLHGPAMELLDPLQPLWPHLFCFRVEIEEST